MAMIAVRPQPVEYAGRSLPLIAVEIGGVVWSQRAAPIDAGDSDVYLTTCNECYAAAGIPNCDDPDALVRRNGDAVVWLLGENCPRPPGVRSGTLWFGRGQYEQALGGSAAALPELCDADLAEPFAPYDAFPDAVALYRIPADDRDPRGQHLFNDLRAVALAGQFELFADPPSLATVRIGLDLPGYPECVVEFGTHDARTALRFMEHPSLPVWLTSAELRQRIPY